MKKLVDEFVNRYDVVVFIDEYGLYGNGALSSLLNSPLLEDVDVRIVRVVVHSSSSSQSSSSNSTQQLLKKELMERTGSTLLPVMFVHGCYLGGNEQIAKVCQIFL